MYKLFPTLLQLPASLAILAFIPNNLAKLVAFVVMWAVTFRKLSKPEAIFYIVICVFFTGMNAMSLKQGIFFYAKPDVLGMPVWELFMWGFFLLHLKRVLGGPAAAGKRATVWTLALLYSAAFAAISDPKVLLAVTGTLLVIGLILFHEPLDLAYTGYLIVFGAAFEYTGVLSGVWAYPDNPPGGVPLWFVTLWGGVGLFMRRLALPILARYEKAPQSLH